jgi:putative acetyltransferase
MEIRIRATEPSDVEAIARVYSTPMTIRGTLQIPYTSVDARRRRMEARPGGHNLVAEVDGEVVGSIGLSVHDFPRRRHAATFGMGVRDDWQGKGVGSALLEAVLELADKWLNLTRLEMEVYTDNEPAIALYKKFGFEIEGTLRKFAFRDGEYVDAFAMSRIRER